MSGAVGGSPAELAARLAAGVGGEASETFGEWCVDVPRERWIEALTTARDGCGLSYFDWLSGVDDLDDGFRVVAHLVRLSPPGTGTTAPVNGLAHLLIRCQTPREDPRLPTATGVFRGAAWHERETFEMFGITFDGHPYLAPLLLPDGFAGHPLRKDFVLAARVVKDWPGEKDPGGGRPRRRNLPPGVPENWGPGQGEAGGD